MEADPTLPSGVVTFVLTDVVSATRPLGDASPDAMRHALALHDKTVHEAVERNGGAVIETRGEGDSTFSVFHRASDGLRAAYDIQLGLTHQDWPTETPIRVRVAVHAGEAADNEGGYVGTTMNRAARLRAVAGPGEIIVSAAVAHLAADHLPLDTDLRSLGEVRLRDLDRSETAFVLAGPGLVAATTEARDESTIELLATKGVTRRERDVFDAVAERLTNAEIAARFSVSERTIETHVSALLRKLGAKNRLELAALSQAHRSESAPTLPPMLAMTAERSVCIGRRDERALLLASWERAARGQTALVIVKGEAGIGKSRLIAEIAIEVHRRGGQILLGSCTSDAHLPYQPFVEALAETIASTPEGQLRADIGRNVNALSRVLPEVAMRLGTIPPETGVDPYGERDSGQEALLRMLSAMARRQPMLLVVEDVHWASSVARDVLLHVARRGGTAPLLVVATTRDTAPELDAALAAWLAAVARLVVCELVQLDGLSLDAATELLDHLGSPLDATTAFETTRGNPLFLREVALSGPSSPTLADLVSDRFARLSDDDLDIVDLAVVFGESIRADLVAAAAERPVEAVVQALERAGAAGIVEPLSGRAGLYAFAHALFSEVRYASLSTSRRLRLHAAAATALDDRAGDPATLPRLARHACIAAALGGADRAAGFALAAGRLCAAVGDHGQAAEHFQRGLDVIDFAPDERQRLELTIRLGDALSHIDIDRSHAVLREAVRLARRVEDAEAFADAVSSMSPDFGSFSPGRHDAAFVALAEEALERVGDSSPRWRTRVQSALGIHLALGSDAERGRALIRDAVDAARSTGEPLDYVRSVLTLYFALGQFENDERLSTLQAALDICERSGHDTLLQTVATRLAVVHRSLGDLDTMRTYLHFAMAATPTRSLGLLQSEALHAFLDGDLDSTEERNRATYLAATGLRAEQLYAGSIEIQLAGWRGEPMPEFVAGAADLPSFVGDATSAALAFGYSQSGDADKATALLAAARADRFAGVRPSMVRSPTLALWAEVAAALGDAAASRELFDLLEPLAGQLADGNGIIWCSIDHARAQLALTLGAIDLAESIAAGAVSASQNRSTPLFRAREQLVLAAARTRRGCTPQEIDPLIDDAMGIADASGARLIHADAKRLVLHHN